MGNENRPAEGVAEENMPEKNIPEDNRLEEGIENENMPQETPEHSGEGMMQTAEHIEEQTEAQIREQTAENMVSRREYEQVLAQLAAAKADFGERLRQQELEQGIRELLQEAGAKSWQAVRGLLDLGALQGPELPEDWRQSLQGQIEKLQREPGTAFLFAQGPGGMQGWVGLTPAAAVDEAELGNEGGFRLRLAQARGEQDSLAAIKIKQEAANRGIFI